MAAPTSHGFTAQGVARCGVSETPEGTLPIRDAQRLLRAKNRRTTMDGLTVIRLVAGVLALVLLCDIVARHKHTVRR